MMAVAVAGGWRYMIQAKYVPREPTLMADAVPGLVPWQ
jgi:hypothetical protein